MLRRRFADELERRQAQDFTVGELVIVERGEGKRESESGRGLTGRSRWSFPTLPSGRRRVSSGLMSPTSRARREAFATMTTSRLASARVSPSTSTGWRPKPSPSGSAPTHVGSSPSGRPKPRRTRVCGWPARTPTSGIPVARSRTTSLRWCSATASQWPTTSPAATGASSVGAEELGAARSGRPGGRPRRKTPPGPGSKPTRRKTKLRPPRSKPTRRPLRHLAAEEEVE